MSDISRSTSGEFIEVAPSLPTASAKRGGPELALNVPSVDNASGFKIAGRAIFERGGLR